MSHLCQNEEFNLYRGDHKLNVYVRHYRDTYRQIVFDNDFVQIDVDALNLESCENLQVFEFFLYF